MATALETLLKLNGLGLPPIPAPADPVAMPGVFQPPVTVGPAPLPPDAAPVAPMPALDSAFVNQYAGAAPIAPTLNEPTTLDKVAAILGGIAGGPGYAMQLRAEREQPIREYERKLRDYEQRRTQGLEIATRKQEREQARTQEVADRNADREFQQWLKRTGVTDELAMQQMRQAFDLQKLREQERIADEKQAAQQKAINERQMRGIESELVSKDGAPPKIAKEISQYLVTGQPLSPAAEKWRSVQAQKMAAQIARLSRAGSGGQSAGPVMARLANGDVVPLSVVDQKTGRVIIDGQPVSVAEYIGGRIPPRQTAPQTPTVPTSTEMFNRTPEFNPASWMNMQPPQASAPQQAGQTFSRAQVNAYARQQKRNPADVEADLKARGFSVQ